MRIGSGGKLLRVGQAVSIGVEYRVGGILRIDVDQRSGNLKPSSHVGLHGNYLVPIHNPFVGAKILAGKTGGRGETTLGVLGDRPA